MNKKVGIWQHWRKVLNVFSNGIKQAWRNFWVMTHSCKDSFLLLRESVSTGIKLLTFPYHRLLACTFRGLRLLYETRNVGNLLLNHNVWDMSHIRTRLFENSVKLADSFTHVIRFDGIFSSERKIVISRKNLF